MDSKKIKQFLLVDKEFFDEESFVKNVDNFLKSFMYSAHEHNREEIKDKLNFLATVCFSQDIPFETECELHLLFTPHLINYGQLYKDSTTFENILSNLNKQTLKQYLSSKHACNYKYYKAHALYGLYNSLSSEEKTNFSKDNINYLLEAKCLLTTIYLHNVEGKVSITEFELFRTLQLLAGVLSLLGRWSESIRYIVQAGSTIGFTSSLKYILIINLNELKDTSYMDFNAILLKRILELCTTTLNKRTGLLDNQIEMINLINNRAKEFIRKHEQIIQKSHKIVTKKKINNLNSYQEFCLKNSLFINEHKFYCQCRKSHSDNIKIQTHHKHTRIEWVKPFQKVLDIVLYEYITLRNQHFQSLNESPLFGHNIGTLMKMSSVKEQIKVVLLKQAFKGCYSILDKIGISTLNALGINHAQLKNERNEKKRIYFTNLWDLPEVELSMYRKNRFLISLYSISKDLDRTNFSALSKFKAIRNDLEHNVLEISGKENHSFIKSISKDELNEKCLILIQLTQTAIYAYTNFIRRQSKILSE